MLHYVTQSQPQLLVEEVTILFHLIIDSVLLFYRLYIFVLLILYQKKEMNVEM